MPSDVQSICEKQRTKPPGVCRNYTRLRPWFAQLMKLLRIPTARIDEDRQERPLRFGLSNRRQLQPPHLRAWITISFTSETCREE